MAEVYGDADLAARLRAHLESEKAPTGVVTVVGGEVAVASIGASLDADFELGSISKGITGLLYVDALERSEVAPETTLGELLDISGCPAAGITLASLSTHTSGLPRLPVTGDALGRSWRLWRRGENPYGDDLRTLRTQARTAKPGRPRPRYSNFGFELLGYALANAAGTTYADLVEARIARPLGLTSMSVPAHPDELRPTALVGTGSRGRPMEAWTGAAIGPAGGVRMSTADLGTFVRALATGSAPGMAALDPVRSFTGPAARIGAAWMVLSVHGRDITWHNGGTGGFRSWLGLDRAAGTGVAIVRATIGSVDRAGFAMLEGLSAAAAPTAT